MELRVALRGNRIGLSREPKRFVKMQFYVEMLLFWLYISWYHYSPALKSSKQIYICKSECFQAVLHVLMLHWLICSSTVLLPCCFKGAESSAIRRLAIGCFFFLPRFFKCSVIIEMQMLCFFFLWPDKMLPCCTLVMRMRHLMRLYIWMKGSFWLFIWVLSPRAWVNLQLL